MLKRVIPGFEKLDVGYSPVKKCDTITDAAVYSEIESDAGTVIENNI